MRASQTSFLKQSTWQRLNTEISVLCVTGRHRHRSNVASDIPEEHFRRNVAIPFMDHLIKEMTDRFHKEDCVGSSIFCLLPNNIQKMKAQLQTLAEQLLFLEEDLETPTSLFAEWKESFFH